MRPLNAPVNGIGFVADALRATRPVEDLAVAEDAGTETIVTWDGEVVREFSTRP